MCCYHQYKVKPFLEEPNCTRYTTVLAREYENAQDTLRSMGEYVEERLIELYPEKAYRGMMSKVAEATMERMQTIRRMPKYSFTSILHLYNHVADVPRLLGGGFHSDFQ